MAIFRFFLLPLTGGFAGWKSLDDRGGRAAAIAVPISYGPR
jgi:hypothetical protein